MGLNKLLDHFPEHRWTGAQEVLQNVAVFVGTHGLFEPCMCIWLDITLEVPRPTSLAAIGYLESSSDEEDNEGANHAVSDDDNEPSKDTAKNQLTISLRKN